MQTEASYLPGVEWTNSQQGSHTVMPTEARSMPEVLGKGGGLTHATPRQGSYTVTQTGAMYLTVVARGLTKANKW